MKQNFKKKLQSVVIGKDDGTGSTLLSSFDLSNVLDLFANSESVVNAKIERQESEEEIAMKQTCGLSKATMELIAGMDLADNEDDYISEFSLSKFRKMISH